MTGTTDELRALEESLWRAETRFDRAHLQVVLADDFAEVGRSGHAWSRTEILDMPPVELDVELPLHDFTVLMLAPGVALTRYRSVVRATGPEPAQVAHRSSVWRRDGERWRLVFHQGTPATGSG